MIGKHSPLHNSDILLLPLFHNVSTDLLTRISDEMIRFYHDGDIIMAEGSQPDYLMVLLHGQVRVVLNGTYLVTRYPYAVLGEQAFINKTTRSTTVIAQGLVQALVLPQTFVEELLEDVSFLGNMLRLVSEKLTEASNERAFRYRNEHLLFSEFRAHLSAEITNRLIATGLAYGEPRYIDAVILFSDIRSFTEQSGGMSPQEIANELGPYLDATVGVIHRHEGLVDKFIGDAVMAIWGYAASEKDPIVQAFACAQEMLLTAASMAFGSRPIAIGIGLNSGQVFIGNIGGEGKRQFTALGSPVNFASRYESMSKSLNTPIVIGGDFYDRLPSDLQSLIEKHENQPIKGADRPQTIYTYSPASWAGRKDSL